MKNAVVWKRVLNEGIVIGPEPITGFDLAESTMEIIRLPIIVGSVISSGTVVLEDYSGMAVPFDNFWIECPIDSNPLAHVGAAVSCVRHEDAFVMSAKCYLSKHGTAPMYVVSLDFNLNREGKLIPVIDPASGGRSVQGKINPNLNNTSNKGLNIFVDMILSNLQLLGCKNVGISRREFQSNEIKRAEKRFGETDGGYRYHVLVVRPPGAKASHPGEEIGMMPKHVCRGHFKEYGPEFGKGLLFGKLSGKFYIPAHVKGDAKNGIVEKDYEVSNV